MLDSRIGPYRIDRELGSGGMGAVYAATVEGVVPDLPRGSVVALKVMHPHLLEMTGFVERFRREGAIGQAVRHENVVRTFECERIGARHVLIMEFVAGQTLRGLLDEMGTVPEELCRRIARDVARGLAAIHGVGAVHRDLKPENVLITSGQDVRVMDMGVARLTREELRLSQSGAFVGSVLYAAPEQFEGRDGDVDGRADLHALGVLLYELSTGSHPYMADGFPQIMHRVVHEAPRRLGEVDPQLSPFFEEAVHCLMAKDRAQRFASAEEAALVFDEGEEGDWWRVRSQALRDSQARPLRRMRIPRETSVHGRERELTALRDAWTDACAGEGCVVLVDGEAGIGKSRLVDELVARLAADGEDVNFLLGAFPALGGGSEHGAFARAFAEHLGDQGSGNYLLSTPRLAPAFDALLRAETPPPGAAPLDREALPSCFVGVTRALAAERPTIVCLEDLHLASDDARALFVSLALAVPGHRVLLLGTARSGAVDEWLDDVARLRHARRATLARLGAKDLGALLREAFHSEQLAGQLAYQIGAKSDGNPFFVLEILRGLREGQFIERHTDGTWVSTRTIDEIAIPSSVIDLVNARVTALTDEERELLEVAACCGFDFDPALVAAAAGLDVIPTLKRLGAIERRHRLVRSAGRRYAFDQHQVQETLYAGLNELLREHYHGALCDALEAQSGAAEADSGALDGRLCVALCTHALAGARGERALRYLTPALTQLAKSHQNARAVVLAEQALAVQGLLTGVERVRVLLQLVERLDLLGRRAQHLEVSAEAERLALEAGDLELAARAARLHAVGLIVTSRHRDAKAWLERALTHARAVGAERIEARVLGNLGVLSQSQGRFDEAGDQLETSRRLFVRLADRRGEASAHINLCTVRAAQGDVAGARGHAETAFAIAIELDDVRARCTALGMLGGAFWSAGELDAAGDAFARQLELAREIGDRDAEAYSTGNLGSVHWAHGRLEMARAHYERQFGLGKELVNRVGEALATGNLGNVFFAEGLLAQARGWQERHLALSRGIAYRQGELLALTNLALTCMEAGEQGAAADHLHAAAELSDEIGDGAARAEARILLGGLALSAGDTGRARDLLTEARTIADAVGQPGQRVLARCHLARLPGGDAAAARAGLDQYRGRMDLTARREANFLLFEATGDLAYLRAAKELLDTALARVSPELRKSMQDNLRLNREITAAWDAGRHR